MTSPHPRGRPLPRLAALPLLLALPGGALVAQTNAGTAPAPTAAASAAPSAAAVRRDFTPADLKGWKTVRSAQLSNDGRWFAYQYAPNEGDAEVVLRSMADGKETRIPIGEAPAQQGFGGPGAAAPVQFSADGQWLAVTVYPKQADARRLRRERRPAQNKLVLVRTATGETREFDKIRRAAFAGERPTHVVLQAYPADAGPTPPAGAPAGPGAAAPARVESSDLLVHRLGTSDVLTVGSVGEFAVDDDGRWLAYTVERRDTQGNGVHVHDLASGTVRVLDSEKALYRRLAWSDTLPQLAVLRGTVDSAASDTAYAVLGFRGFGAGAPRATVMALAGRADAPKGMRVSPDRTPRWTVQGDGLLFGLREKKAAPPKEEPDDEKPNLMIWHWKEARLQSQQQVQEQADKTFSYLAAFWPGTNKVVALSDSTMRQVQMLPTDRWALGTDGRADERRGLLEGLPRVDQYVVDPRTGERRLALGKLRQGPTLPSPDGRKLLYFDDGHYHALDLATLAKRNLTSGASVSFWDTEDDHNVDKPATFPVGWAKDGSAVLLSDNWDIWKIPAAGGAPVNLTRDGRTRGVRYQSRVVIDPRESGIDLGKPMFVRLYGERTKQGGLARVDAQRGGATTLVLDDAAFNPRRARDADVWVTSRSTFAEYPDWWRLENGKPTTRLTNGSTQLASFKWSAGTRLVNYVTDKGDSLQGTLYLPADYREGQKYPTVTYIYEKLSQGRHQFSHPNEVNGVSIHPGLMTSRGYAVFMPDIVYKVNDPGMSAVWSVVPAVKAAIATGIVDSARVGLQGHSWGGYQTAFLVTQTDIFKSAIAGAPLTDLVSMYSSVYWNSGLANQPIFQSSQGRFTGNYLQNMEAYARNSPNRHADKIKTPLVILHNDKDGAVDFNQGITFYNTLKQLGKEAILLEYPGENHGLVQRGNLKDYQTRMMEWFDVHLKGAPAPDWIERGVPRLQMDDHLRARKPKPEPKKEEPKRIATAG
jgi:dipeptidyl aminopeptidase/acylaminoacyl peptidase